MFRLLSEGAYPHAGMQLIEALREYERELERRPRDEGRRYWYRRGRSEFSWQDVLGEYFDDPLDCVCLRRANWTRPRPTLYVATYVTERDNLVIEVRPGPETGFSYMGLTHLNEEGDFRHFPIYTAPFARPTNRVLYIPLGDVSATLKYREPWVDGMHGGARYAFERRILLLAVKAKLHQLSLHFDCHIDRELIEFGPESYIDFRRPTGDQGQTRRAEPDHSMAHLNDFDPAHWAPPRIREFLSTSSVGVEQLYAFAQEYLAGLPPDVQVQTYAQYLASTHGNRVTAEDVKELLRYGADLPYRKAQMLEEMTGDANFAGRMQKHWMFDSFCRHFDFTKEQGFEWVMTHHPQALEHLDGIPIPALIRHLKSRKMRAQPGERGLLDRALAMAIANEEPSRWTGLSQLRTFLDGQALNGWGFASFNAFQAWARKSAPMSFEASTKLADTVAQRIEALEAEEQARRTAANNRRKATRAAKKAGAQGASR